MSGVILSIIIVSACIAVGVLIPVIFLLLRRHQAIAWDKADQWLVGEFRRCNVMVFGKKGSGKDVIFSHVIALRGELHYSNIPYDANTEVIELSELSAGDNTFEDCINGTIRTFEPRFYEGCDIYVSDAGIYFPNTENKKLDERYPSMPVLLALSRHLYNNNIHTNCQAFDRPWKKIREQADSYIQVLGTRLRGDYLYVKIVGYDKYRDAENEQNPAVKYTVRVPIGELQYDSRYFRKLFFENPPTVGDYILEKIIRRTKYVKPKRKADKVAQTVDKTT